MTINRLALLGALLTAVTISPALQAAGKFYKWTDESGVVHYGEKPPVDSKATVINVNVGRASDEAEQSPEAKSAALDAAREKEAATAERQRITSENSEIVKENCKIYQQNLSALKNSARIREKDPNGEYRYLTDEEKAERTKAAEAYLQENCQ